MMVSTIAMMRIVPVLQTAMRISALEIAQTVLTTTKMDCMTATMTTVQTIQPVLLRRIALMS